MIKAEYKPSFLQLFKHRIDHFLTGCYVISKKIFELLFLLIPLFAYPQVSRSMTLELINLHIQAAGGIEAHENLKSISRFGTIKFFIPNKVYSYRTNIIYPNMLREELRNSEEILVSRGTDGRTFWSWDGGKYSIIKNQAQIESMVETANSANRDLLWIEEELEHLVISVTPEWANLSKCMSGLKNGSVTYVCFDERTGLLTAKGNDQEYRTFSKWTRIKNIHIPFTLTHFQIGKKVYQFVINSEILYPF